MSNPLNHLIIKWFAIVLKFKGMFSILKLAATTTLYSGKSFCINGKVQLVMQVLIRLSVTVLDEERLWRHTVLSLARFLLRFLVPIYSQQRDSGLMDSAGFQSTVDVHLTATGASHSGSDDDSIVGVYPARHSALSFRGPWSEGLLFSLSFLCFILGSIALTAGAEAFYQMLWV